MLIRCCHFQVVVLHRLASLYYLPSLRTVGTVIHNQIGKIGAIGTGMTTNYAQQAGCAGCRQGMRDPLSELCDKLPGLEAGDITALLRDLPIPIPGDVPGMKVEEAIEVLFCVYQA
jgi:hypothetical protein